jgi:two-component system chemotaxis response regulator CheB
MSARQASTIDHAAPFDVVAVGASAGGVPALQAVVGALPKAFPAAVLVVLHLYPHHKSVLAELLGRRAHLRVKEAMHDERVNPGTIYVAPPDTHLGVIDGRISLTTSGQVHFSRPSIDKMLESVAVDYGDRAIGVVLTGSGFDGATGIRAIKREGGTTIVQDPSDAEHPGMPTNAWQTGCVDFKLPLDAIVPLLVNLMRARPTPETTP